MSMLELLDDLAEFSCEEDGKKSGLELRNPWILLNNREEEPLLICM